MEKILFAIGMKEAETYIKDSLTTMYPNKYSFVGECVHKGDLVDKVKSTTPDIVIIKEGLPGPTDIFTLCCQLKRAFPKTRVIFASYDRKPGDKYLQKLATFQIYDILSGTKLNINKIIEFILNPADFAYGSKFLMAAEDQLEGFDVNIEDEKKEDTLETTILSTTLIEDKKAPKQNPLNPGKGGGTLVLPLGGNKGNTNNDADEEMLKEMARMQAEIAALKKQNKQMAEAPVVPKSNNKIAPKNPNALSGLPTIMTRGTNPNMHPQFYGKDKIVTFYGAKNGIGTTTVAYNVAMELAYRRKNVLYIELNDVNPMIAYWYDVYSNLALNNGIDKAVLGFETGINKDIDEALITRAELIKNSGHLSENFKRFPATLDYLFYSAAYIESRNKQIISNNSFSQVLLYFMQQLNYNYLILDINTRADQSLIETALTFSNKNFIVVSQEFSTIGYYQRFFEILRRKGLDFSKKDDGKKDLSDKNSFIVNRYVPRAQFDLKTIKQWIEDPEIFLVADNAKDIADLSFNCKPIIKDTSNKDFILNIAAIATAIETS